MPGTTSPSSAPDVSATTSTRHRSEDLVQSYGELDAVTQRDAVRRHIGLVFHDPTLDNRLTAAQNLRLHAELYGIVLVLGLVLMGLAVRRFARTE
jgi:hypothetical protein